MDTVGKKTYDILGEIDVKQIIIKSKIIDLNV